MRTARAERPANRQPHQIEDHTMKLRIHAAAVIAAALVSLASSGVVAQPAHRGHGFGAPGDFTQVIVGLKSQLGLDTSQQTLWDSAVAQSHSARDAARTNFAQVKAALDTELAKPEPDLAAVAAVADSVRSANDALRKQVRSAWLALYANLSAGQKGIVRDALQARVARFEALRQKMLERRGG
jgi:Spy/CpxP family protein refolding chaperone